MRRERLVFMLAPLLLSVLLAGRDVARDPALADVFGDVMAHSGLSNPYEESAAFLIADGEGDVQCSPWPRTNGFMRDTFDGAVPPGTVAIVHTHPAMDRMPTDHDVDLAKQLHLPMIVLTRSNIALFDPVAGATTLVVNNRNWVPRHLDIRCDGQWLRAPLQSVIATHGRRVL